MTDAKQRRMIMNKKTLREFGSRKDIGMSLLWYAISYVVVTWIGIGHTIFNILVLGMSGMSEGPGLGMGYNPVVAATPPAATSQLARDS